MSTKKNKLITTIITCFSVIIISFFLIRVYTPKQETRYLLIYKNASFNTVMDSLKANSSGVSAFVFEIEARLINYPQRIHPGRYKITNSMMSVQLLNNLLKSRQEPIKLTFNNIRTKEQLCARLSQQLMTDSATLFNLLSNPEFLAQFTLKEETAISLFIPDTYEVYWTISPEDLIKKIAKNHERFWNNERTKKADEIGLKKEEISTLASIVEEETNSKREKPIVAGLYINRLKKGMKLQADPTIKFALKDFGLKRIREKHIFACKMSPYNTYLKEGLPPGPIRIPSIEGLEAVLNYTKHNYLFMCVDPDKGEHFFTSSYNEHLSMANKYQNSLEKRGIN